jgi:uncharacterized protein YndB with AHSA1/START domain
MTVISVVPDQQAHTLTLTAQYAAPVEDVWQLWADPRQLERWWGPPTYPATVLDHDLSVGGRVRYVMTGPEGDQHAGWWRIAAVAAPTGLEFDDGFGDPDAPSPSLLGLAHPRHDQRRRWRSDAHGPRDQLPLG